MGAGVAVPAVILRYLRSGRPRQIHPPCGRRPARRARSGCLLRNGAAMSIEVRAECFRRGPAKLVIAAGGQRKAFRWGKHSWHLRCRSNEHLLVPSHDPTSLRYVRFTSTPAVRHMKRFPDALPDAVTLELPEDIVNRRARRKQAARRMPPRTARAQEVENRVHRRAHVGLARPPAGFRRRNQRLQTLPLRITQIAGKGVPDCLWSPYALASTSRIKASEPSRRR